MATNTMPSSALHERETADSKRYLVPLARFCLSLIFLQSIASHFSPAGVEYATRQGVPWANIAVPISGLIALVGGISVLLGYRTRVGVALLVLFLIPVTLIMHRFWNLPDPEMAQMQRIMFLKNVSILGGILLLGYFGGGPVSVDDVRQRSHRVPKEQSLPPEDHF
ncbi:MAG: DoxX family protein [Myxococcota bacterium]